MKTRAAATGLCRPAHTRRPFYPLCITGTPATVVVDNQTGQMQLLAGAQPAQAFIAAMKGLVARAVEEGEG